MRGRKPKPIEQRILEGNPGKRRLPAKKFDLTNATNHTPTVLTGEAAKWFKLVSAELRQIGVLKSVDIPGLTAAAQAYANMLDAVTGLCTSGGVVVSVGGKPGVSPYDTAFRLNAELYRKLTSDFGLNPADRTRLASSMDAIAPALDPQEELMKQAMGLR